MDHVDCFSATYQEARARFRKAARARGFELDAWPIENEADEDLTVDVAIRPGPEGDGPGRALLVSSGLHGVEGYFGSAAQLALLKDEALLADLAGRRLVLIHALNPWGMAHNRRWDEDNVDLNRNFLPDGGVYAGATEDYRRLNALLNPETPPSRRDFAFSPRAIAQVARHGLASLKNALAGGQYEFPHGLYFGGSKPAPLRAALKGALPGWLEGIGAATHFDLHTGLGPWGVGRLFVDNQASAAEIAGLRTRFGAETIVAERSGALAMAGRGLMRDWLARLGAAHGLRVLTAEFGTYPPVMVLQALRAENRAWRYGARRLGRNWAMERLRETFVPESVAWRRSVIDGFLKLCRQESLHPSAAEGP